MRVEKSRIESETSDEAVAGGASRSLIRPQTRLVRPTPNIKHPVIESNECTPRVVMAQKQEQEKALQANNVQSKRSTVASSGTSASVKGTIVSEKKARKKEQEQVEEEEEEEASSVDVEGGSNSKKDQVRSSGAKKYSFKRRSKEKREENRRRQQEQEEQAQGEGKIQRHQVCICVSCHSQFPKVCHLILQGVIH